MKNRGFLIVANTVILLAGCAAIFVPATSDPGKKLGWAVELFEHQDRPLPAGRLIEEAIDIYTKENNQLGLAEAYRVKGIYLQSRSVVNWSESFTEYGFADKSLRYGSRYESSLEYLQKALGNYTEYERVVRSHRPSELTLILGKLSNLLFLIGNAYAFKRDEQAACSAYNKSIEYNREALRVDPNQKFWFPPGYATYEEALAPYKQKVRCE